MSVCLSRFGQLNVHRIYKRKTTFCSPIQGDLRKTIANPIRHIETELQTTKLDFFPRLTGRVRKNLSAFHALLKRATC